MNIEDILSIDISLIEQILNKNERKKIIIFGIGTASEFFMKYLPKKFEVNYFVDNKSKDIKFLNFYNVYSPEVLLKENRDDIFVLILTKHTIKIKKQLEEYGLEENKNFLNVYTLYEVYFILYKTILDVNNYEDFLKTIEDSSVKKVEERNNKFGIYGRLDVRGAYFEYCLTWAVILLRKGYDVTFILDDLDTIDIVRCKVKTEYLRRIEAHILQILCEKSPKLQVKRIYNPNLSKNVLDEEDKKIISQIVYDSSIWHESRLDDIHINLTALDYEKMFSDNMTKNYPHIKDFFRKNKIDTLISNDLIETQGLVVNCARSMGINCVVYDGPFFNIEGGVSQGFDLKRVFINNLLDYGLKRYIIRKAKTEFEDIQKGNEVVEERSHYQRNSVKDIGIENDILILLNFEWDAAVLGLSSIFGNFYNWLYETLDYIIYNTSANVIVRDHPGKVFYNAYLYKDFNKILTDRYSGNTRLTYIAPEADCNTYSYIKASKLILTYSSTTGIDSYLLGKNVILGGKSSYSDFGFVYYKETKKEYFECINYLLEHPECNKNYIEEALITFYLVRQMWCKLDFNSNKNNWMSMKFGEIEKQAGFLLECIEKKYPVCYLKTLHEYESQISSN